MPYNIDAGPGATDRAATQSTGGTTRIELTNPANANGTITEVELWFNTDPSTVKIGVFYLVSGTTYHCRSACALGAVASGSKQTITVDIASNPIALTVVAGDLIGYSCGGGAIEATDAGVTSNYYATGYFCDVNDEAEFTASNYVHSIYAQGNTAGWANISKIAGQTATDMSKVSGIAVADIAKIYGTAV